MKSKQEMVKVNGGELYFELAGKGKAITFCNGTALDTRLWDSQFDVLAEKYQVMRYDNRDCGRSGKFPDEKYRYEDDLKALLDCLEIEKTIAVGLSVGGGIAINLALNYPGRVSGLILLGPFLTGYDWPYMRPKLKQLHQAVKNGDADKAVEIWCSMDWFDNIRNDEEKSAKLQKMVDANAKKFFSKGFPPQEKWEPDMAGRLKEITVPVLVMVGEKDSPDNKKVAEIIRQNIHNTEFMLVPDSGHMTCIENPDFVNKQILKFLQKY